MGKIRRPVRLVPPIGYKTLNLIKKDLALLWVCVCVCVYVNHWAMGYFALTLPALRDISRFGFGLPRAATGCLC